MIMLLDNQKKRMKHNVDEMSFEELKEIKSIPEKILRKIYEYFHSV